MWKKLKEINYRHWICAALWISSLVLCLFIYKYPVIRVIESGEAFCRSIAYTFLDLFGIYDRFPVEQTVNNYTAVNLTAVIGFNLEMLRDKLIGVWGEILVWEHFVYYLIFLLYWFTQILYYVCIFMLVGIVAALPVILTWDDINNDYNEDTKPLQLFKRFKARPWGAVVNWCKEFLYFFRDSWHWGIFVFIWLINLEIITVALSFFLIIFGCLHLLIFPPLACNLLS